SLLKIPSLAAMFCSPMRKQPDYTLPLLHSKRRSIRLCCAVCWREFGGPSSSKKKVKCDAKQAASVGNLCGNFIRVFQRRQIRSKRRWETCRGQRKEDFSMEDGGFCLWRNGWLCPHFARRGMACVDKIHSRQGKRRSRFQSDSFQPD